MTAQESTNLPNPEAQPRRVRVFDWVERVLVLCLYGWLVVRIVDSVDSFVLTQNIANIVALLSEGLVVVLILCRRRPSEISPRPFDWLLAVAATTAPLLVQPGIGHYLVPPVWGALLVFCGFIMQVVAKVALGRSFGCVPAHRGLKYNGPYQIVRHPMYTGYLLSHVGFLVVNPTLWNLTVYLGCYAAQIPRLLAEERLLRHDPQYADYMANVRYRLIPGVF